MKKIKLNLRCILIALISLLCFNSAFAKGTNYYEGKGRIAISSDGNKHDNDDKMATKMTLMILAKAGLQDKTVLYTHCDHVWGSEGNDVADMKLSADTTGRKFGFNKCSFIAAVEDPEAAYQAMADVIAASTAEDPLFIIAAGPMHVVGMGFEKANKTNPEALNYVTVISHSWWNEVHADNYEKAGSVHGEEDPHSGWTWEEMKTAFGSKVNFNHISDQNATGTGAAVYTNKDKFSAPNWSSWDWMKTHSDPNIQWVYAHEIKDGYSCFHSQDYSDAGIAYYMVADLDDVRGDEFGNPAKLQKWVGTEPIPVTVDPNKLWGVSLNKTGYKFDEVAGNLQLTASFMPATAPNKNVTWSSSKPAVATVDANGLVTPIANGNCVITVTTEDGGKTAKCDITIGTIAAGDVTVGFDYIAIEADATNSDLGKWVVRKKGDDKYDQIKGNLDAINGTYIEYTGSTNDGLGASPGTDPLVYRFTPAVSGSYTLTGRMAQQLNQPGGTAAWDQCNDIYIKMEGDYTPGVGSSASITQLSNWNKFYGRGQNYTSWGSFVQMDINHVKYKVVYKLEAGKEYTFSISARSRGVCIDYFLLTKAPITFGEQIDVAYVNDERLRPGGDTTMPKGDKVYTYTAAKFEKFTGFGGEFVDAVVDYADARVLSIDQRLEWGAAETPFTGKDGRVKLVLNTKLEADGESTFKVYLNSELVKEVTNKRIHGTDIAEYTLETYDLTPDSIDIKNGDIIRVEFNSATNGLVPEGNTTATSRGRWVSLQVMTTEIDDGTSTPPPPFDGVSMLDQDIMFFENTAAWELWAGGGPYTFITNTNAADIAARGKNTLHISNTGTWTGDWTNINTQTLSAFKNFKLYPGDEYVLKYDIKVVSPGSAVKFELRFPATATTQWGVTAAVVLDLGGDAATDGWVTKEKPLEIQPSAVFDEKGHDVIKALFINDFLTDKATARNVDMYIDNIRIVPADGFVPNGSDPASIEVTEVEDETLFVTAHNHAIEVKSEVAQQINVYNISGLLISSTQVAAGETVEVASNIPQGIYIVNNKKVFVK